MDIRLALAQINATVGDLPGPRPADEPPLGRQGFCHDSPRSVAVQS
jgi:hypothetical protein